MSAMQDKLDRATANFVQAKKRHQAARGLSASLRGKVPKRPAAFKGMDHITEWHEKKARAEHEADKAERAVRETLKDLNEAADHLHDLIPIRGSWVKVKVDGEWWAVASKYATHRSWLSIALRPWEDGLPYPPSNY